MIPATLLSGTGMGLLIASLFNFVLAGVDHAHAGSASGILSTTQELGSAIGIAVLGVLFFNFVGTNAVHSARGVEPQIRQELSSLQLPEQAQKQIVDNFTTCFNDRSNEKDPDVTPESCKQTTDPHIPAAVSQKISDTLKNAGTQANKQNFLETLRTTLYFQIALVVLVVALIPLLPKKAAAEPVIA
jgi:hypothetical protein